MKCDKQVPCSNCARAQTQCVFPAPGRAPRRPRQGPKVVSEREAELLKRLRRLEGVVEELSGQVEIEGFKHSPSSDNSATGTVIPHKDGEAAAVTDPASYKTNGVRVVGMDEGKSKKEWLHRGFTLGLGPPKSPLGMQTSEVGAGRLVLGDGKSQYVSNPFWASISEVRTARIPRSDVLSNMLI